MEDGPQMKMQLPIQKNATFPFSIGHVSLPEGRQFSGMLSQHLHAFFVHDLMRFRFCVGDASTL